ncbi:MAG: TRAP transporter small permease [Deferrisomatales bacterium]|nr:TRAP transporter small permease [Deferrisomatales bacterium]
MWLRRLNLFVSRVLDAVIGLFMVATVGVLFVGVVTRYVFNAPLFWAEEVTVLGLVWMTFLAGAILVRTDKNVSITVISDLCRPHHSRVLRAVSDLLVLVILVVMLWQSWRLTGRLAFSTTPALRLSEAWFGRALIVGFSLMLFYQVQRFVGALRDRDPFPEDAADRCKL